MNLSELPHLKSITDDNGQPHDSGGRYAYAAA